MKGFWYIIEGVLAGIILIGFLLVLASGYARFPAEDIGLRSYRILHELDQQGMLGSYAANNDYQGLNSQISLFGYNHSVQICSQSGICMGSAPDAGDVWVGNYMISGLDAYNPKLVRLYIWRL